MIVYQHVTKNKSFLYKLILVAAILNMTVLQTVLADENKVGLIEDDSSECLANDGKLILLKSDAAETMVVWLDRWFMGVQTADHTKHIIQPGDEPIALGCSVTRDKEKQYWTIASALPQ